jgi:hypothetical protein
MLQVQHFVFFSFKGTSIKRSLLPAGKTFGIAELDLAITHDEIESQKTSYPIARHDSIPMGTAG